MVTPTDSVIKKDVATGLPGDLPVEQLESPVQRLPQETLLHIFRFLSLGNLARASEVCREWHMVASDKHLWNSLLMRNLKLSDLEDPKEVYRKAICTPPNLTRGIYSMTYIDKADMKMEYYCCEDDQFIEYNYVNHAPLPPNCVAIRNLATSVCGKRVVDDDGFARKRLISNALIDQGKLIIGHKSGKIQIFDFESRVCTTTIIGNSPIWSLVLKDDGNLISGHLDGSIQIWDAKSCQCIRTLKGDIGISSLCLTKTGDLISGDVNGVIKIWDLNRGDQIRSFESLDFPILSLCLTDGGKLIVGQNYQKSISVVDFQTGHREATFSMFVKFYSLVLTNDQRIIVLEMYPGILNFNASNSEIFAELATIFADHVHVQHSLAMERFSLMPAEERQQIYVELYRILNFREGGFSGSAEHAFHDLEGLSSTPQQKALAIRNYLSRQSSKLIS